MKLALALIAVGAMSVVLAGQSANNLGYSGTTGTFDRSRKVYAALRSYADSGTVVIESASKGVAPTTTRYSFKTYYRAPMDLFFEFNSEGVGTADHYVVWADAKGFHSWSRLLGEDTYPAGIAGAALGFAGGMTFQTAIKVAPLIYRVQELPNVLIEFVAPKEAGTEVVDGRACHKVEGLARWLFDNPPRVTNARRAAVWIDADTLLVRKVFEDTPREHFAGDVLRITTTFEPQLNPTLDDSKFRFNPPK